MSDRVIRDCKVVVIGGAGFLGSHLVNHLIDDRGCAVTVLDNLLSGHVKNIHPKAHFVWFDITHDSRDLAALFHHHAQYVFNYAAMPYIPDCYDLPNRFLDVNANAVLNVFDACLYSGVQAVLQMSSSEIYGGATEGALDEQTPICPHSTYALSKLVADQLAAIRYREAKVPVVTLRQFNCVGERETHQYIVPEIISQLCNLNIKAGDCPAYVSLGNNTARDFMYAGDAAKVAALLLERGEFGQAYNSGSGKAIGIYDLARRIASLLGHDNLQIQPDHTRARPWEVMHLCSNNSKINSLFNWTDLQATAHRVDLDTILLRTLDYYHTNGKKWDWNR